MTDRPTIFISYAHADEEWKNQLLDHLKAVFGADPPVEVWEDRQIRVGDVWRQEIEEALARARAAVLLVSASFLASGFIQREERPTLLERHRQAGVRLLPLLVRDCPWQRHWLAGFQMWPRDALPIKDHPKADSALAAFANEVATCFDVPPSPDPAVSPGFGRGPMPPPPQPSTPRPAYLDEATRLKGEKLERAYQQRQELCDAGDDTADIDTLILSLKRDLRQGPQLHAGEFLGDGRYQLIKELGHGGFATVWLARVREENQRIAIKVLHGQFSTSEERRWRFFRGAQQMAKLDHPNIVKVLCEPVVEDGWAYYVMEYLEGGDFRRAVLDGRLTLDARLGALGKIAEALDYAHQRGIIHRDVKPANILLSGAGEPKLTDFDLVQAEDSTGLTRTRAGMGSYHYAAPECQEDAASATPVCDVYSFAATLAFALSGKELGSRFLFHRPAFLSELDVPEAVCDILAQALHLEPEERPSSASVLFRDLQAARSAPAKPVVQTKRSGSVAAAPAEPAKPRARPTLEQNSDLFRTIVTPHDGEVALWREIPAGEGVVGSREGEGHADEKPRHRILVTRPFWMSAVPITNAQYAAFDSEKADLSKPDHPVVKVTWHQAIEFCAWLAKQRGFSGARLPTEEEWEYACRAGSETTYWSGDEEADLERVGWYDENSGIRTHAVGEKPANPWGLYDVHGNVWEWTASIGDAKKYQKRSTKEPFRVDPTETPADLAATPGEGRVVRGGGFSAGAGWERSAYRGIWFPDVVHWYLGFRVLLSSAPSDL